MQAVAVAVIGGVHADKARAGKAHVAAGLMEGGPQSQQHPQEKGVHAGFPVFLRPRLVGGLTQCTPRDAQLLCQTHLHKAVEP